MIKMKNAPIIKIALCLTVSFFYFVHRELFCLINVTYISTEVSQVTQGGERGVMESGSSENLDHARFHHVLPSNKFQDGSFPCTNTQPESKKNLTIV
jgi:hypothetical protein